MAIEPGLRRFWDYFSPVLLPHLLLNVRVAFFSLSIPFLRLSIYRIGIGHSVSLFLISCTTGP